jgi:hypothetical protein
MSLANLDPLLNSIGDLGMANGNLMLPVSGLPAPNLTVACKKSSNPDKDADIRVPTVWVVAVGLKLTFLKREAM